MCPPPALSGPVANVTASSCPHHCSDERELKALPETELRYVAFDLSKVSAQNPLFFLDGLLKLFCYSDKKLTNTPAQSIFNF